MAVAGGRPSGCGEDLGFTPSDGALSGCWSAGGLPSSRCQVTAAHTLEEAVEGWEVARDTVGVWGVRGRAEDASWWQGDDTAVGGRGGRVAFGGGGGQDSPTFSCEFRQTLKRQRSEGGSTWRAPPESAPGVGECRATWHWRRAPGTRTCPEVVQDGRLGVQERWAGVA